MLVFAARQIICCAQCEMVADTFLSLLSARGRISEKFLVNYRYFSRGISRSIFHPVNSLGVFSLFFFFTFPPPDQSDTNTRSELCAAVECTPRGLRKPYCSNSFCVFFFHDRLVSRDLELRCYSSGHARSRGSRSLINFASPRFPLTIRLSWRHAHALREPHRTYVY